MAYANMRWYMPFFGTVAERDFQKKISKAQKHIQMMVRCAPDFFSENTLGHGPEFWISFPGFTDKG